MNAVDVSFALRCAADGEILQVLDGRSRPPDGIAVGQRLQELVPSGAEASIRVLLGVLRERPVVLCRPIEFGSVGGSLSGFLCGGRHGAGILLAFGASAEGSARAYEELLAGEALGSGAGQPALAFPVHPGELSDVMEALDEGLVIQVRSGAVLACNERARALLGLSTEELEHWQSDDPGWRLESESEESLSGEQHPAREVLRSGEPVSGRIARVTRPDGSGAWLGFSARPLVHLGESEPYAVACSVRDVSETVALRGETIWDEVTGLHSQAFLLVRIEAEVSAFARYGHPVCLGLCTVDEFDAIVAEGAEIMNIVLQEVGQRLRKGTRGSDVIAHVGGSEFCLLMPYTVTVDAGRCAERLRQVVGGSPIVLSEERALDVTVSFGVAGATPGMDTGRLVAAADQALDEARSLGANRVFVALDRD